MLAAATLGLGGCAAPGTQNLNEGPLSIAKQGSFFVGGRNVNSSNLSLLLAYAPAETIAVEQMFVRYQVPVDAVRRPRKRPAKSP